jgi:Metallo-beta-lactamase superfamily
MMLRLQMLPAGCGDCLWLEYGTPPATNIVIIDGGLRDTATALRNRIQAASRERGVDVLPVELLVVTHIDNDHILGIIELLKNAPSVLRVNDVWFNGRPQLMRLPPPSGANSGTSRKKKRSGSPADLLGGAEEIEETEDESDDFDSVAPLKSPSDLLGPQQSDELSMLLATQALPWNQHELWKGKAVMVPDNGELPVTKLEGELKLTLLGPTLDRLYKLCTAWPDVLGGIDELTARVAPADLLGRRDTWPPVWKEGEGRDPSRANGSSIMLLAEYGEHALLLAGDGHAPDIAEALERLCRERQMPSSSPFPLAAFKLPHHASENNVTRAVLERVDCSRYLISTNGSPSYRHPDHQALLRVLRYSKKPPQLLFNYLAETTRPWRDSKSDVVQGDFQDYEVVFPTNPDDGLILELN